MGTPSAIVLVLITILLPPAGVFLISGCGSDLLINICLTLLGYIPGHIHAFYLEYVYYERQDHTRTGILDPTNKSAGAGGQNTDYGGTSYGTVNAQPVGNVR